MDAIATRSRNDFTNRQIDPALLMDFVTWIDRSAKTARTYTSNLRQFLAWMKYSGIQAPARNDILNYRDWLTEEHDAIVLDPGSGNGWNYRMNSNWEPIRVNCRPNTVALYMRSVCQFFAWTAAAGLYPNIAANIHPPKVSHDTHRKEALTAADVQTIERSISAHALELNQAAQAAAKDTAGRIQRSTEQSKRLFAMFLLAVNAGLRTVEISRANVKDLETRGGQAWLYIWGKGHAEPDQRKPLAREVAAAIKEYLDTRADNPTGTSPLFVSTGNRAGGKRIAPTTISTMLKAALQQAGYNSERLTAHSLRHTAGTTVQGITGNLYTTQIYMRHSNPATTEIYLHNDTEKDEIHVAQQLYNAYHAAKTPE